MFCEGLKGVYSFATNASKVIIFLCKAPAYPAARYITEGTCTNKIRPQSDNLWGNRGDTIFTTIIKK